MEHMHQNPSLQSLHEIKDIMNRSSRFLSLSGMSGIWAGCTALAGSAIAYNWLKDDGNRYINPGNGGATMAYFDGFTVRLMLLGISVFVVAFAGAFYFTRRKARRFELPLWSTALMQMLMQGFFPMFAGGAFCVAFIYYGCGQFVAPACLAFYGLALVSASRHTLSDIRYLGMLHVALGCSALFFPYLGLYFWALGFGVLHILYGSMMWNKYEH